MLGRIAKLYYEYNYTHQQIADLLGWNRVKVTRALQEARQQGIVHIAVFSDEAIFVEEERELCDRFGLTEAWVAPSATGSSSTMATLATIGADAVEGIVGRYHTVAVGVSETLASIASTIRPRETKPDSVFVPLQGTNPGLVTPPTPSNIASAFATAFGGRSHALAAPVFPGSAEMLEMLSRDPNVKVAFETAISSDAALVGIGGTGDQGSIILRAEMSHEDAESIRAAGAVGDINARFYDADGRPVHTPRTSLVLGPSLEEFTRIPVRVAAAAGPDKVNALHGALNGKLITALITDEQTARALLATGPA